MANKELYKLLQISDVLVAKYGYTQVLLQKYHDLMNDEAWLFNKNAENYIVIRLTFSSASQYEYEKDKFDEYIKYFKTIVKNKKIKILDIHINKDKYNIDNEPFDYFNIDEDYYDGFNISNIFPEIKNCIHHVENQEKEVKDIVSRMTKNFRNNLIKQSIIKKNTYLITYVAIALCVLNYLLSLFLKFKYDDLSSIFVVLGADYKTFTLGLNQFYRLFTYAFVHNDIIHLLCNMYSLWSIGRFLEVKLGRKNYTLILIFSIISGALTQGILNDNGICIGISGGIYGLMVAYIFEVLKMGMVSKRMLLSTISINLFLNFLSTTAWMCHLGGAIGGYVIYFYLQKTKDKPRLILCIAFILCLFIKFVTTDTIESIYAGTDLNVIKIYNDLGLSNYAEKLLDKLLLAYSKFGG